MNRTELKPGLYRLTETVENPHVDRRSTRWYLLESWKKGMIFMVVEEPLIDERNVLLFSPRGWFPGAKIGVRTKRAEHAEVLDLICSKLEPYVDLKEKKAEDDLNLLESWAARVVMDYNPQDTSTPQAYAVLRKLVKDARQALTNERSR